MSDHKTNSFQDPPPPRPRIKNLRVLILLLVLLAALLLGGRMLWQASNEVPRGAPPWQAFVFLAFTVWALWVGRQESERATAVASGPLASILQAVDRFWGRLRPFRVYLRLLTLLVALLLTVCVLRKLPGMVPGSSYTGVTLAWGVAFLFYLLAVVSPRRVSWDWSRWWRQHRREIVAAGGIVLLAFLLRAWRLETIPFTLGGDEGSQGLEALRVINGELHNPFSTGWLGVPTMSFFFNSVSIRALGRTVTALRLPWTLVGTATVLVTFLLVRQLKGTRLALVTAAFLATYHYHIHYSRLGSNQVADPFFLSLALLFLYRGLDRRRLLDWVLAGGVTGLAFYFYAGARLTPIILVAVLAYLFICDPRRFWQQHRVGVLVAIGAFLIVAAPMIQYATLYPGDFNARLNQVGIIQSGWLEREVGIRNESMITILFDQFRRAALAFNYYPDRTVWYGLRQPLLGPFFGGLFLLGLIFATIRLLGANADRRLAPMVAWWWGGMILGGMMTESPPSSQRLITLAVPVCFLLAWILWELVQLVRKAVAHVPADALLAIGVFVFAAGSFHTYFIEHVPQHLYGGSRAHFATRIAPRLRELAPEHRIYFVGAPWMYWGFATLPYLVPGADAMDLEETLTAPLSPDLVTPEKGAVFIFTPERAAELDVVRRAFPEGEREATYSPADGQLLGLMYVVPPQHGS